MFEAEIIHAEDIAERLEVEARLSPLERKNFPDHRRVPSTEFSAWWKDVERKIAALEDQDLMRRLQLIPQERNRQLVAGEGDEITRFVNFVHGTLRLLRQIDRRLALAPSLTNPPAPSPAPSKPGQSVGKRYDVFISHASEDKEGFARPLYKALRTRELEVWFDQATLELGDSLRQKIEEGLANCRFGVVILSPYYLPKEWPLRELDALVARETAFGEKAILPVLHNLTIADLTRRLPMLAGRLSISSSDGVEVVADAVTHVVRRQRQ